MTKALVGMAVCAVLVIGLGADAFAAHSDYGCVNCHVAHKAVAENVPTGQWGVPLWSPYMSDAGALTGWTLYNTYAYGDVATPSLDASLEQPNGPTKLCLGCHDGSYDHTWPAGRVFIPGAPTGGHMSLKNSHPVSFYYPSVAVADSEIKDEDIDAGIGGGKTIAQELLDSRKYMQCSSCHDVHASGFTDFLLRWNVPITTETVMVPDPDNPGNEIPEEHALHISSYGSQVMCRACHLQ